MQSVETLSALEKHCDQISQSDAEISFVNRPNPIRITDRDQAEIRPACLPSHTAATIPLALASISLRRNLIRNCSHSCAGQKRLSDVKVLHRRRVIRQGDHSIFSKQGRQRERLKAEILPRAFSSVRRLRRQTNRPSLALSNFQSSADCAFSV